MERLPRVHTRELNRRSYSKEELPVVVVRYDEPVAILMPYDAQLERGLVERMEGGRLKEGEEV